MTWTKLTSISQYTLSSEWTGISSWNRGGMSPPAPPPQGQVQAQARAYTTHNITLILSRSIRIRVWSRS